jgi:hypothetical protein
MVRAEMQLPGAWLIMGVEETHLFPNTARCERGDREVVQPGLLAGGLLLAHLAYRDKTTNHLMASNLFPVHVLNTSNSVPQGRYQLCYVAP